jgi:hypothetical protein
MSDERIHNPVVSKACANRSYGHGRMGNANGMKLSQVSARWKTDRAVMGEILLLA